MMDPFLIDLIVTRLGSLNAKLVGRAYDTADEVERQEFARWFLALADRLGLVVHEL
jgi:hypothetical protein